jgi:UDPglucose--hexose-1-phosphate uridylyltransferase
MDLTNDPHRRYNILTGEWVLVSPHRTKRPWQGKVEAAQNDNIPEYDPKCYLCPGNERAGGINNPKYDSTYVFVNDFSALLEDTPKGVMNKDELLIAENERGICKVICFSPRHDLTFAKMNTQDISKVIDVWIKEYHIIGNTPGISYVQIFENRGAIMGCSNAHPHGQIWSNSGIPMIPAMEDEKQSEYFKSKEKCMLCDYLKLELKEKERIVFENSSFVVLVPFWAVWPFEVMILPKRHITNISDMNESEKDDLSQALNRIGICYDNLFKSSFPYSMGIHQKPTDEKDRSFWHFHLHYFPPLLRSAAVKKFMVGYEMLANPQRDITAESSAARLRELPAKRYA